MAITALVSLRGYFSGLLTGSRAIAPTDITDADAPSHINQKVLASGDNSFSVPANADGCIIVFDSTSTTVKTLKGNAADTGIILAKNRWNVITFDTTPIATIIINSSAADTGKNTEITFF